VLRRIEVPADIKLDRLHLTLQPAFGWTNSHLYEIRARDVRWGLPYAWDRRQSVGVLILFRPANELGIKGGDPSIELSPLRACVERVSGGTRS
jgi:hypothetical protein